jgi:alkylated DNA repair dioxygenase AlkB
MPQMPLFESAPAVLADDTRGRIEYTPGLVAPDVARRWFEELRAQVPWSAERRRMYDREVDVPRLVGDYRLEDPDRPEAVRAAARAVVRCTRVPFNSVGLNLYRDGRDSVAPHSDHTSVLVEGYPIALLSLGAVRRLTIRAKQPPRLVLHVDLEPASLLVMSWDTQTHYLHGVPKTDGPVGERISLAFRVKPDGSAS